MSFKNSTFCKLLDNQRYEMIFVGRLNNNVSEKVVYENMKNML